MSDVRTPIDFTDLVPFKVPVTLYEDTDHTLLSLVLDFSKVLSSPVEDGPGHKAYRTKVLKGIVKDITDTDTPDTDRVVKVLNGVLNPSKTTSVVDTDVEFASVMEFLKTRQTPTSDTPDTPDGE